MRGSCHKSKGSREIEVNHKLREIQKKNTRKTNIRRRIKKA